MDYHPRRIFRNLVTQDSLFGGADSHEGSGPSSTAALQEVGVSADKNVPYTPKDIPFPDGLRQENIKCVLGEDVVVVFEYSLNSFGDFGTVMEKIEKVFYHLI